jgi:hypothetical protein
MWLLKQIRKIIKKEKRQVNFVSNVLRLEHKIIKEKKILKIISNFFYSHYWFRGVGFDVTAAWWILVVLNLPRFWKYLKAQLAQNDEREENNVINPILSPSPT